MPYANKQTRLAYVKNYKRKHRERLAARRKELYKMKHPCPKSRKTSSDHKLTKKREKDKRYREKHKITLVIKKKEYYQQNKKEINSKRINIMRNNIQIRIAVGLRNRLNKSIKSKAKVGSAVRDLGCSIEYFIGYIERLFTHGMSWNNWGDWHLDHVFPLSKVDLTDREEFESVAHYTNYQPLWATVNYKKRNKITA
jgi:hypothetical protein